MTIDWLGAAGAGVVGALVMTLMTDMGRMIGMIDANLTRYQGCLVLRRSEGAAPVIAGLGMHLAMERGFRCSTRSTRVCATEGCGDSAPSGVSMV